MSIKSLFESKNVKILSKASMEDISSQVESEEYIQSYLTDRDRIVPHVDFNIPANFARYGLAQKYYEDSFQRVYNDYPFDGSLKEKLNWQNSSSYIDNHIFENKYPRTTGYINFSPNGFGTYEGKSVQEFGKSSNYEYITIKGGPNEGPDGSHVGGNIYNATYQQESNLRFGGDDGNAVEFWFKGGYDMSSTNAYHGFELSGASQKEVFFDLWNGKTVSHAAGSQYGRFSVYLDKTAIYPDKPFRITYVSGTISACTDIGIGDIWHLNPSENLNPYPYPNNATWNNPNVSITPNAILSPDEINSNASAFVADAVNNIHCIWNAITSLITVGQSYTFSTFVREGNQKYVYFKLDLDGVPGTQYGIWVDLSLGKVVNTNGAASMSGYGVDDYGNGWFRIWFNITAVPAFVAAFAWVCSIVDPTSEATLAYLGDGASEEIYVWGISFIQIVNGCLYPYRSGSYVFDQEWNHYAISTKNVGTDLNIKFYLNGELNETKTITNGAINEVTGALIANIGALRTASDPLDDSVEGYGKLSGSLDEFRFWKTARTSEDIGLNWFCQVGGGANSDVSNTDLGVYYKFNEGITQNDVTDAVVLDYSGRISHGVWTGYSSSAGPFRSIDSAMDETFTFSEFKDPIVYSTHPLVDFVYNELSEAGLEHDLQNNSSIYNSFPDWIRDDDSINDGFNLKNLCQMVGSYFDQLHLQIQELPRLKHINTLSGSSKPYPFSNRLLESCGFKTSEIFADIDAMSQFADKDNNETFAQKLHDIKNTIYQNIYDNIVYIYKSKGTEKAFRNLIRCFGVDEEIIKLNLYGDNVTYEFSDAYKPVSEKKKYVDFNDPTRFGATVYQYPFTGDSKTYSYISSSLNIDQMSGSSFTMEAEVILPKKYDYRSPLYFDTPFISASLFGAHQAVTTNPLTLTWANPDNANFQVYAVHDNENMQRVYFYLTGTSGGYIPPIASEWYSNVYENEKWNLAVRVKPTSYPFSMYVSGSNHEYQVELYGVSTFMDTILHEFCVTGTISNHYGNSLITKPKRLYVGAHRTNFNGAIRESSDVKISSVKYWLDYISDDTIKAHAKDVLNYGSEHPYRNTNLFISGNYHHFIPEYKSLALNWDFNLVTGSDASGQFTIVDASSGSSGWLSGSGFIGSIADKHYTGLGDLFPTSNTQVVDHEFVISAKQRLPEILDSSDMVQVLERDDEVFTRTSRPIKHFWMVEKSMYQTVSEEMIKMFATIKDFNNLIGEPVNRYRQEYKDLGKIRQSFFERVQNTPDVEKYMEYFKWFDQSMSKMIEQLIPASANMSPEIHNVIESHVLERNKYWTKYPTLEMKMPELQIGARAVNELLYNYKRGSRPIDGLQSHNCLYWNQRALRNDSPLASTDSAMDASRGAILSASYSAFERKLTTPINLTFKDSKEYRGGANFERKKNLGLVRQITKYGDVTKNVMHVAGSSLKLQDACSDESELNKKYKYSSRVDTSLGSFATSSEGRTVLPFNFISSSFQSGFLKELGTNFYSGVTITNVHGDVYGELKEIPMQGVFTEKYVGGLQYRHNAPLSGTSATNRAEGWKILTGGGKMTIAGAESTGLGISDVNLPRATYYREEMAKRPINIRNIKNVNYEKNWQIVQTNGRSANNKALILSGGFSNTQAVNGQNAYYLYITGTSYEQLPKQRRGRHEHVIVNRFSAPGETKTMGDSDGGIGLDIYGGEYSVYNNLNYRNMKVRGLGGESNISGSEGFLLRNDWRDE